MNRTQVEHILRAAAEITGEKVFVIVGSTAILAQHSNPPAGLIESREVDIYPKNHPEMSELIEGAIGQGSMFEAQHGYYADGVGPETAILPYDWESRAISFSNANTGGAVALAPEIHDLAVAKLYAGREKDIEWVEVAAKHGLIDVGEVKQRFDRMPWTAIEEKVEMARHRADNLQRTAENGYQAARLAKLDDASKRSNALTMLVARSEGLRRMEQQHHDAIANSKRAVAASRKNVTKQIKAIYRDPKQAEAIWSRGLNELGFDQAILSIKNDPEQLGEFRGSQFLWMKSDVRKAALDAASNLPDVLQNQQLASANHADTVSKGRVAIAQSQADPIHEQAQFAQGELQGCDIVGLKAEREAVAKELQQAEIIRLAAQAESIIPTQQQGLMGLWPGLGDIEIKQRNGLMATQDGQNALFTEWSVRDPATATQWLEAVQEASNQAASRPRDMGMSM